MLFSRKERISCYTMTVRYALHVDGKTLTVYEADELELAREHARVVAPRTSGPILLVQIEDDAEPVIVERVPGLAQRRTTAG